MNIFHEVHTKEVRYQYYLLTSWYPTEEGTTEVLQYSETQRKREKKKEKLELAGCRSRTLWPNILCKPAVIVVAKSKPYPDRFHG